MRGGRGEGAKRMPHHPQQERAIVVATNHPLFFVLILLINASKYQPPSSEHEHEQLKLCKEFHGGAPHHWLKPGLWWYIQDIQVVLRENLPTGDGLTGGKMLASGFCNCSHIPTFPWINIVFVTIISNLDFFQGKGWQKMGKKHAFDACSTGSWLVAAFQGAVTIVRVIFSTVSPGLSPPQLLTDSTKN